VRSLTFNFLKLLIGFQFPTIETINCNQLAQLLLNAVSHIETAVLVDPLTDDLATLSIVSKDRPVVVYCAVGYRSAKLAQQLDKAGMKCIYNLSGGIFQWANEGRLMFRDERPTQVVHPYNAIWGKLLKSS
jgi:rhodanese-related sulfurtransferase